MTTGLAHRVERLRSIDLFSRLDHEALALVASLASEVDVPAGLVLTEPKQPGSGMFAITDGRATAELRGGTTRARTSASSWSASRGSHCRCWRCSRRGSPAKASDPSGQPLR
jgi:hypothetical protein